MASMATNSLFHLLSILTALVAAEAVTFTVTNKCTYTVWPAATPVGGGTKLDQGQSWTFDVPTGTASGRVWGRTGCSFDDSGRGTCTTGDCGGVLACTLSGRPPLTIAEFTLNRDNNQDYFDLSLIDGFNVPMNFLPDGDGAGCSKGGPRCSADVTAACPAQLKTQGGCNSACTVFNTDTYCCRGEFEQNCPPTDYSKFFKEQCPDAYSYAKDDQTSTFTCPVGTNYQIVFCP